MNILRRGILAMGAQVFNDIRGGWRTVGAPGKPGSFAFDSGDSSDLYTPVSVNAALKLSAVVACVTMRAETIGAMQLVVRERETKRVVKDHDLYSLLARSPNFDQTKPEYTSADVANVDMLGNSYSMIDRRRDKSVIALTPIPLEYGVVCRFDGKRLVYDVNGEEYSSDQILHQRGFSMDGYVGLPRLTIGRDILSAQLSGNDAAMRAFKNNLKVGGFFETPADSEPLNDEQYRDFQKRLAAYNDPNNQSKWMPLPPGFKPVDGTKYRISMQDAQLLESRYFGIEEICRLFNTPPPLIGHTNKSSSWASSTEQLNLHFLIYSLVPTLVRREERYVKQLMRAEDREKYEIIYLADTLQRLDAKTRSQYYASGLQNGYFNQNEIRAMEGRMGIGPEGDIFRVQMNMAGAAEAGNNNEPTNSGSN